MANHVMTYPGPDRAIEVLGVRFYAGRPQIVQGICLVRACQALCFIDNLSGSGKQVIQPHCMSGDWILATGYWNDEGVWDDTAVWKDGP